MLIKIIFTCLLFEVAVSDFYVGMYQDEDYLVSRDFVFKQATPGRRVSIEYGRLYKCPITYILVKDRVGLHGGPKVVITKGGLRTKFLAMNIISPPGLPVSAIVTVACTNPHGAAENEGIDEDYSVDYQAKEEKNVENGTRNKDDSSTADEVKDNVPDIGETNSGETTNTAEDVEITAAPADGDETTAPAEGVETTAPEEGVETTAPAEDGETTVPAEGVETTAPAEDGETTVPAEGVETTAPAEDGETTVLAEGGEMTVPAEGGENAPDGEGGDAAK